MTLLAVSAVRRLSALGTSPHQQEVANAAKDFSKNISLRSLRKQGFGY
jgi:hypothetical protein